MAAVTGIACNRFTGPCTASAAAPATNRQSTANSPLVGAAGDLTGHAGTGLVVLGALVAASAFAALW